MREAQTLLRQCFARKRRGLCPLCDRPALFLDLLSHLSAEYYLRLLTLPFSGLLSGSRGHNPQPSYTTLREAQ
jgi:hypothetical protein